MGFYTLLWFPNLSFLIGEFESALPDLLVIDFCWADFLLNPA